MKRILGTVAALAGVLAFGTISSAATFVYDVTGTGSVNTLSDYATAGGAGQFVNPFTTGSSISLDITGSAVTILGGTLNVVATNQLLGGALGSIDVNSSTTLSPGGVGTLTGSSILWDLGSPVSTLTSGFFILHGGICSFVPAGTPCNSPIPISFLSGLTGTKTVQPILPGGTWTLSGDLLSILGTTRITTGTSTAAGTFGPVGTPLSWYLFGSIDGGHAIPEPGAFALVLLGLGGLALRRKA